MSTPGIQTLTKDERLHHRTLIERLFNHGGGRSMAAFPVRLVYIRTKPEDGNQPLRMMVSVPKRHFKRAVRRNRVKRQLREAFRKNKNILYDKLKERPGVGLAIAFIWLDDKLWLSSSVEKRVVNLMYRLAEKID